MSKSFEDLPKRILTAVLGGVLFLYLLLQAGLFGVRALTLVLTLAMLWEWGSIVFRDPRDRTVKLAVLVLLGGTASLGRWSFGVGDGPLLGLVAVAWISTLLIGTKRYSDSELKAQVSELFAGLAGFVWIWLSLQLFGDLGTDSGGQKVLLFFLLINWSVDVGAYFCGRLFGRRQLFGAVSPKKSVEGAVGATVLAIVVGAVLGPMLLAGVSSPLSAAILSVFVAVFAQLGDLAESLIKRAYQIKDSSGLLPGHGGFLDRFDGVLLSLPVMVTLYRYLSSVLT